MAYYGAYKAEGSKEEFNYDIKIKVHLPKTAKKMKIVVERERNEISRSMNSDAENMRRDSDQKGSKEHSSYVAGVTYKLFDTDLFETNIDTGIKILLPLNPYMKIHLSKRITSSYFNTNLSQGLILYRQDGFSEVTQVSFDKKLNEMFSLSQGNALAWSDETDKFGLRNSLSLGQLISDRRSMSYSVGATAELSPSFRYISYDASISYRQLLYKKWFFGSLVVGSNFPKDKNFKMESFVGARLEVYFR
jgi:hypothetical protein